MILFSALLVPVFASIICLLFFRHKMVWWEFLIPFVTALIVAGIFKITTERSATSDTEFWTGYVVKGEFYERWDEYIHQTCTRSYPCGRDANGNTQYCTETYDCSYVDDHPAYWEVTDNNGITKRVSSKIFDKLVMKFDNSAFVDLGRNYHRIDGDKYVTIWPNSDKTIECMVTEHNYENRVQASRDIYNFPEIDTADIRFYGLYEYPSITDYYKQQNLLGDIKNARYYNRQLEILNAKLGKDKQVKAFILLFRDKQIEAAYKQEAYWKGGNKNELVLCIGLDNNDNVTWVHPFSWTENQIIKINLRTGLENQGKLNLTKTIQYMYSEIDENFIRKHFKEFDYITIEPTTTELMWTFIITLLINIIVVIWAVKNEFNN